MHLPIGTFGAIQGLNDPQAIYAELAPNIVGPQVIHVALGLEADFPELNQSRGSLILADLWPSESLMKASMQYTTQPAIMRAGLSDNNSPVLGSELIDYASGIDQDLKTLDHSAMTSAMFFWWGLKAGQYLEAARQFIPGDNLPPGLGAYFAFKVTEPVRNGLGSVITIMVFRDKEYLGDFTEGTLYPWIHEYRLGSPKRCPARCIGFHVSEPNLRSSAS